MPSPLGVQDELLLTIAAGQTASGWVALGNPGAAGLFVPALGTATTVTVQVARDAAGTSASGLVNTTGAAQLALASSSGGVAISSNDMGAVLGFPWIRILIGAAQAGPVTFSLQRKMPGTEEIG